MNGTPPMPPPEEELELEEERAEPWARDGETLLIDWPAHARAGAHDWPDMAGDD